VSLEEVGAEIAPVVKGSKKADEKRMLKEARTIAR
jgi:hypothetical protein